MATKKKKQEAAGAVKKAEKPVTFSKERILSMPRYRARRDLLSAHLADSKSYTREEADAVIEKFTERKGS